MIRQHSRRHSLIGMRQIFGAVAFVISLLPVRFCSALPFMPGDLLVTENNTLIEFTPGGAVQQAAGIPYPHPELASCLPCEIPRDVTVLDTGHAAVYNGTFDPYLSTFDAATLAWTHQTVAGLSTVNNVSYGGIANAGRYVFMTDMNTAGDTPQGIVRFDLQGGPVVRFAQSIEPIDLNVGLDGLLYALDPSQAGQVQIFDPVTTQLINTVHVSGTDIRAVAADKDGSLFVVSWLSTLYHFDPKGVLLSSLQIPGSNNAIDVDLSSDGRIAVGDRFGLVTFTDRNFSGMTQLPVGNGPAFVAFVPVPEPSAVVLSAATSLLIFCWARRPR